MCVLSALNQMLWAQMVGYSFHLGVFYLLAGWQRSRSETHIHYASAATLHLELTRPAGVSVCHSTKYFMSFIDWSYSSLLAQLQHPCISLLMAWVPWSTPFNPKIIIISHRGIVIDLRTKTCGIWAQVKLSMR